MLTRMAKNSQTQTTEEAYRAIRRLIVEKRLAPGARINQIRLSEELHSSRTPVSKALHLLAAHDLVRHVPNSGFFVTDLSVKELYELFTLRESLETVVVRDLAPSISDRQIETLQEVARGFEEAATADDEAGYRLCDEEFHAMLVRMCPNRLVKRMFEEFEIHSRCFTAGLIRAPGETLSEHLDLISALTNREVDRACLIIGEHMARTREYMADLVGRLDRLGVDPMTVRFRDVDGTRSEEEAP